MWVGIIFGFLLVLILISVLVWAFSNNKNITEDNDGGFDPGIG